MPEPLDRITVDTIRAKTRLRRQALAAALNAWSDVAGIDDGEVREFIAIVGPGHRTAVVTMSRLVDSYLVAWLQAHGITPEGDTIDPDLLFAELRSGTTVDEELARPFIEARTAISRGAAYDQAMSQAAARLQNIIGTDLQQSYRLAGQHRIARQPTIRAYRRVLVGSENCSLCITASTVRYRSDKLMPIHPGCDCSVAPLDPGQSVNRAGTIVSEVPRLEQAKRIIREQTGVPYLDRSGMANLKVNLDGLDAIEEIDHGELGPILAVAKHRNTTLPWNRRSRREFDAAGNLIRG